LDEDKMSDSIEGFDRGPGQKNIRSLLNKMFSETAKNFTASKKGSRQWTASKKE
jgi:hypothetical protein